MQSRSILIIGAGVGGLSTGIYALMNGYRVEILEQGGATGGVCAAWRRGGYVFDGCIHNLAGTSPRSRLSRMWRELGVIPAQLMHAYREMVRVERPDGEPLVIDADLDRLSRRLTRQFPEDAGPIEDLVEAARRLKDLDLLGLSVASPLERLAALRRAPDLIRYGAVTLEQFARRFKDPFLRQAFPTLVYDWPQQSVAMLLSFMAGLDQGDLGWPIGGSAALAHTLEQRFLELGGRIRRESRVTKIRVEAGRATGVRLQDGTELSADVVVSNAYGPDTLFDLLGGAWLTPALRAHYLRPEDRVEMGVHVALGVNRELPSEPHAFVLPLDPPAVIAGEERQRLYVQTFAFDPSMAPHGKSVIKVLLPTSWKRWEDLHRMPELYRNEKQRILEQVIVLLDRRFPGLRRQIEASDVATPMTTARFTANRHGFKASALEMILGLFTGRKLSQTLPGLKGFYMVGQWAGMPGVPMAAAQGRDVVREICRRDGRPFATVAPPAPAPPRLQPASPPSLAA